MHLIVRESGEIVPAAVLNGTVDTVAVTFVGEFLKDFHILPTDDDEIESCSAEYLEHDGFPTERLVALQRLMASNAQP